VCRIGDGWSKERKRWEKGKDEKKEGGRQRMKKRKKGKAENKNTSDFEGNSNSNAAEQCNFFVCWHWVSHSLLLPFNADDHIVQMGFFIVKHTKRLLIQSKL
jgi:hypothetical protein